MKYNKIQAHFYQVCQIYNHQTQYIYFKHNIKRSIATLKDKLRFMFCPTLIQISPDGIIKYKQKKTGEILILSMTIVTETQQPDKQTFRSASIPYFEARACLDKTLIERREKEYEKLIDKTVSIRKKFINLNKQ